MPFLEESWQSVATTLGFKTEEEMLYHLYIEESCSIQQISKIVGYSSWSVRVRILKLGITLRPRGGANNPEPIRALSKLTDQELFNSSVTQLITKYNVHPSTVSTERRLRIKLKGEGLSNELLRDRPNVPSEPI